MITATLHPAELAVEPGQSVAGELRLRNDGPDPVEVHLAVTGPARPYAWIAADLVTVPAGAQEVVRLGFRTPRAATPPAGPLAFEVTTGPPAAPAVAGTLQVLPYSNLSASLAGGELTIGNRGNAPMPTTVRVEGGEVDVRVDPASVTVPAEGKATATVAASGPKRPLVGAPLTLHYRLVATPEVGSPAEVGGHVDVTPAVSARTATIGVVVAAVALVAGLVAALAGGGSVGKTAAGDTAAPGAALSQCPAKDHVDAYGVRGLQPNEIAKLPHTYTFLRVQSDGCTPTRFNPCEPVHYIQNAAAAPPDVAANVREAFRRISGATGITFVDDGLTDENARAGPYVPERYGSRWAPILIVWDHFPAQQTTGAQQILGNTNPLRVDDVTVSGRLRFNVDAYNDEFTKEPIQAGFGPPPGSGEGAIGRNNITWGRIVLHELAHLVGLGHTGDPNSIMYPDAAQQTVRPADFRQPDFEGLRYLGKEAGCLPTPTPRPT